ncbi:MAG: cache domain-containing protein [Desulfobacterales bacterium]
MGNSRLDVPAEKRKRVFTLRSKVMLIFLALTLAPLLMIGYFSFHFSEELIISMVVRQLENVAEDKAALLEGWLGERMADITMVAETSLVQSMDPDRIRPYLDLIREKYGVYKELVVVSGTGGFVAASPEKQRDLEQTHYTPYLVRKDLFVSDITYAHDEKESSFLISAPVTGPDDSLSGTVYGSVGTKKIILFILNVSLGATGECYLVDRDGRFLAHKDPHRILSENISQSDSFRKIFEKTDHKSVYLDYRGIEVLGASLQVGGTDWFIVVEQDRAEAFAAADKLKNVIYLTLLLCIISAFMLTSMVAYHIVSPIRKLSQYAGRIADSRFDAAVEKIDRNDEIGLLFDALADMAARLQERHNHLEKKVGQQEAELKETDLILQKTRLMAERSEKFAAMGRMGAAVAHEIRTPLTSIKLFLESVQAEIDISPEYEEDFNIAMNQIGRIESTINRFLDFAKPQDLIFSEIELKRFIADLLIMVRPQVNRQECVLNVSLADDMPAIIGDRRLLAEALINLLVNALDAMPTRGTLTVSAVRDIFTATGRDIPCVRIDIADTGHGIADGRMEKIFEPFFTTKATGTGLGLSLVLTTIRNHGGVIRVKSKIGEGTVFSLFLPVTSGTHLDEFNGKNIID